MNLPHEARQTALGQPPPGASHSRLEGRRLIFARVIWLALIIPSLGLFVIATALYATRLSGPDQATRTLMLHPGGPLSGYIVSFSRLYGQFGDSLALMVVLASVASLVWIAVGLVIAWRKSDDGMGLLTAFGLIMLGLALSPQLYMMEVFSEPHALWRWPIIFVDLLGWGSIALVLLLFPDGRFVPRWMGWAPLAYLVFLVAWGLPSNAPLSMALWPPQLIWLKAIPFLGPIFVQLYRYWHPSGSIQRQQIKLVVFAIVTTMLADVGFSSPLFTFSRPVYTIASVGLYVLSVYLFPLALGVAVLRYRLWDIDILINRALVYGALTALLAGIYVGLVLGLQVVLGGLLHQSNPIALVVSTLTIYVLFQPLRRRIQALIDRRFYRRKYDAARTLAAFSATLRHEVDLATLSDHLIAVVQETMQPASVSLWLRPPFPQGSQQSARRAIPAGPAGSGARQDGGR